MSPKRAADADVSRTSKRAPSKGDAREAVFIGTSGWAYSSWKPAFYPPAVTQKKFLEYYATQLNSVEVNYTFRQLPTRRVVAEWLKASGPQFRFSFKAPQRLTHMLRLKNGSKALGALSRALAPVEAAGRMGVVLFQLPPNFKADPDRLDNFLADARMYKLRMAFEFRHPTWFSDEVYEVLRDHGAALCVAESEDLESPDVVTAGFAYYRWRKSGYSAARLASLVKTVRRRASAGEVFAYFKHEEEP